MRNFAKILLLLLVLQACGKKENTVKPTFRNLTEAVYASGNLVPQNEYKMFALAEGYIVQKLVREGETVKIGQALFVIDNDQQRIREQTTGNIYNIASMNASAKSPALLEIEAVIENARNRLVNDSTNYVRYRNLFEKNAIPQIEHDRAKLAYQNAKNDYILQIRRYERTRNDLSISLENAKNQYEVNAKENSNFVVRSKINGMVYETYKEEGETVRRNEAVALLGSSEQVYLKLAIDELDISKIAVGQEVVFSIDIMKDKVFKAKISKIYPSLNRADQSFRVDAELIEKYSYPFVGLTVEANIIVSQKTKALVIPKNYLIGSDSVRIIENGEKRTILIKKGIENYDWVEVLEGLKETDELVK